MSDISELMTRSWGELEKMKPQPLPEGHWRLKGDRIFFFPAKVGEDGKQKSAQMKFAYRAVAPLGDVDPRTLDALGDYEYGLTDVNSDTFFLSDVRDLNRVMAHLAKHDGFVADPDEALLIEGDDGLTVNPAIRRAFAGSTTDAVLSVDDYKRQGEEEATRNIARRFTAPDTLDVAA